MQVVSYRRMRKTIFSAGYRLKSAQGASGPWNWVISGERTDLRKSETDSYLMNRSTNGNIVLINKIREPGLLAVTSLCFKSLCVTCVAWDFIKQSCEGQGERLSLCLPRAFFRTIFCCHGASICPKKVKGVWRLIIYINHLWKLLFP